MPPADMGLVFGRRVLAIIDQDVGSLSQLADAGIVGCIAVLVIGA